MSVALNEYSTHRNRLIPVRRSSSYVRRRTVAVSRWSRAASARNAATAAPIGRVKSGSGDPGGVPGGPVGSERVTVTAKSVA
jgi:hypothetical protein